MRMKDIPWFNRPWTKIKRKGVDSLDDAELLALIFIKGNKINNTSFNAIELSNKLLKLKNIHQFQSLSTKELKDALGDEVKAFQVQAISEICKRYAKLQVRGFKTSIESSTDVYNYFKDNLESKKKEHLCALLLDSKNRIIKNSLVSIGTLNKSLAHPREVFCEAIKESANSIILVHNHPSGDATPSSDDKKLTKDLMQIGNLLGISVLDHVIVGKGQYWSYMDGDVKESA